MSFLPRYKKLIVTDTDSAEDNPGNGDTKRL
jgi:hypothetical protein